jgi:type II secretory pathway pseudopilin PulG
MRGYMRSIVQNAPMLQWHNYGGLPLAALNYGDVVQVWEQVYDMSGNTWHYALYNNQWGYIQASYLTAMTPAEVDNYFKNQARPTTPPVAAPTPGTEGMSGYAMVTGNGVNFRTGPSTNDSRIAQLPQRTLVRVMDSVTNNGETWYYCESNGRFGYLHGDYVSMLTVREYQLLVSSPSYDQGGNVITPTATAKPGGGIVVATQRPGAANQITFVTIPPMSTVVPSPTPQFTPIPTFDPYATPTATAPGVFFPGGMTTPTAPPPESSDAPAPTATFPTQETSTFTPPALMLALVVLLILAGGGLYGYSVYNKARRKQAQEQAQRLAAEARRKARQEELGVVGGRPAQRPQQNPNPYARPQASPAPRAHVDGKPVEAQPPQPAPTRPPESAKAYMRPAAPAKPQEPPTFEAVNPAPERPLRTRMPVAPPPVLPEEGGDAPIPTPRRRRYNPDQPREEQGTDQQTM